LDKSAGLTDVISLLEDQEVRELDLIREADMARSAGLTFERFTIPDRGVPASFKAAHELWNLLAVNIRGGRSIGIHCRAGIGRSGLITTGVLVQLGVPENHAWQRVSTARGVSVPDTDEQRRWLSAAFRNKPTVQP
jgi:protein-tyrosine phosphatase